MQEITLKIDGMMCGMCEAHVCDAIRKSGTVKKVTASHTKGVATIIAEDNFDEEVAVAAIEKEGYRVLSKEKKPYEKHGLFGRKK